MTKKDYSIIGLGVGFLLFTIDRILTIVIKMNMDTTLKLIIYSSLFIITCIFLIYYTNKKSNELLSKNPDIKTENENSPNANAINIVNSPNSNPAINQKDNKIDQQILFDRYLTRAIEEAKKTTCVPYIEGLDISQEEKAKLYEQAVTLKRHRPPKNNPFK